MKKSILFVSHALELGGAERALIALLDALDPEKYDVDLFLLRQQGELLQKIPSHVHVLPEICPYTCLAQPFFDTLKKKQFGVAMGRVAGKYMAKRFQSTHPSSMESGVALEYSHKYTKIFMPQISQKTYDLAVSFLTPHYFVAEKVRARKKAAWIHTDYSALSIDTQSELSMWSAYDYIVSISDRCTRSFLGCFPSLEGRIVQIENLLSPHLIQQEAGENAAPEMNVPGVKLLSIGRFCAAKNFDNVPDICRRLRQQGLNVHWFLIGYGGDEALIRSKIAECGMRDYVTVLGKRSNPYPYIKVCDLYVQPSRYEGNCVSVHEAQILEKPVVITRYATSSSQLEDGVDGVIVPMDNEGCAAGIAALLRDPAEMQRLSQTCGRRDYSNRQGVEGLYQMMG